MALAKPLLSKSIYCLIVADDPTYFKMTLQELKRGSAQSYNSPFIRLDSGLRRAYRQKKAVERNDLSPLPDHRLCKSGRRKNEGRGQVLIIKCKVIKMSIKKNNTD